MSTARLVGKGIAWNTIGSVLDKVLIFGNLFLILNVLSVYEYGLSELVLSVISTLAVFLFPGLDSAITSDLSVERAQGGYARMHALFRQYFSYLGGFSAAGWVVLMVTAPAIAHGVHNDSIAVFLQIASFLLLASPFRGMALMLAAVEARFLDQALYSVVEEMVKGASLLICFFVFHTGVEGLFIALVVSQWSTILLFLPRTISAYRIFSRTSPETVPLFWAFFSAHRKWSIAVSYLNTLHKTALLWIVRFLLGTEAVGYYAFASGIIGQVMSFLPMGSVLTSVLPRLIEKKDEFVRLVNIALKVQTLSAFGLMVVALALTPFLFIVFPKYLPAVGVVVGMLVSIVPAGLASTFTPVFATLKAQRAFFVSMVWKGVWGVISLVLGCMVGGVVGIGVGFTLGFILSALERILRMKSLIPTFSPSFSSLLWLSADERSLLGSLIRQTRGRLWSILFAP